MRQVASRGVPPGAKPFRLIEAMFETVRLPDVVPRFSQIMASPSGVVWLLPYSIPYAEGSDGAAIV